MSTGFTTGPELPDNFVVLDWKIPSFTIPAGSSNGQLFDIPNTQKSFRINPLKNLQGSGLTSYAFFTTPFGTASAIQTTNHTDNTSLLALASYDNGQNYDTNLMFNFGGSGGANRFVSNNNIGISKSSNNALDNSNILLKLAVQDLVDPTTDIMTLTSIRVSMLVLVMK